jgi:hypothetical protein
MAQLDFNPETVADDERDFPILPDGTYNAQIIESDLAPTKNGTGQRLNLTIEIIEGPAARRRVWEGLNIVNANAQAQEISQRTLKQICNAIGHHGVLTDSEALHFKPLRIRVGHKEAQGEYKAQNVIKGYEALGSVSGGALQGTSRPTHAANPQPSPKKAAASSARPWA